VFLSSQQGGSKTPRGFYTEKKASPAAQFFFGGREGSIYFIGFSVRSAFWQGECKTHKHGILKKRLRKSTRLFSFFLIRFVCV
jgi:hypothetical protein